MGGKGGCADEDQGVDDGAPDRGRQALQAKRSSPRIREAKDQAIQRRQTRLKSTRGSYLGEKTGAHPSLFLQVIVTERGNELVKDNARERATPQTCATTTGDIG